MTVCPSSLHSRVQGTNFPHPPPPSEPPGEIMSFGVSPVNYSDSDSESISDYSWEVYIVHSGVFAGEAYMHEDRTCVGIFNLHVAAQGITVPAQGASS